MTQEAYERGLLPRCEEAIAQEDKFKGYFLNEAHAEGRGKAKWFKAAGYTVDDWEELRDAILEQITQTEAVFVKDGYAGQMWEAVLTIEAPKGTIEVCTAWELLPDYPPRLITAYAGEGRSR